MISTWRTRRAMRRAAKKTTITLGGNENVELSIPAHFRCPISLDLMKDPVTLSTGITYDRESIEAWIDAGNRTCPVTNQPLRSGSTGQDELIPNHTIRRMIQDWCVDNRSNGVERIPTPRIPVSTVVVLEMLSAITEAAGQGDLNECKKLLEKMKNSMKESERNKRRVVANGAAGVLADAFDVLATNSFSPSAPILFENSKFVLEEILALLSLMRPLDSLSKSYLSSSQHSLRCMAWFLKCGDMPARRNAALAIKELCSDPQHLNTIMTTNEFLEELIDPLFKLIKNPICATSTKASLMSIYYLMSSKHDLRSRFVKTGMVPLILEMLVDSDKSVCEKGLGVFDEIIKCEEGIELAYNNALTAPVLVKKLLRVSDLATEFAVSALWRLCENGKNRNDGDVFVEVLQVGAFQKLLLLLQVGCGEKTKNKATELLKILNLHRTRAECIESVDFKDLKRPF
ncbi:hypothetical protein Sjap_014852 [Stephania japonica]|uniref:U-box domain-containing protein n=1 Tax=Stephania japonica TaxID=461633 RepID=A0AAP0IIU8_9MAGN